MKQIFHFIYDIPCRSRLVTINNTPRAFSIEILNLVGTFDDHNLRVKREPWVKEKGVNRVSRISKSSKTGASDDGWWASKGGKGGGWVPGEILDVVADVVGIQFLERRSPSFSSLRNKLAWSILQSSLNSIVEKKPTERRTSKNGNRAGSRPRPPSREV